jgi:hypothetical protein
MEKQAKGPMYNITSLVTISPFESPSSFECEEGKRFEARVGAIVQCANNIHESI